MITNPATGETVAVEKRIGTEELSRLVAAARRAQRLWAARPLAERRAAVARAGRLIAERAEALSVLVSSVTGKSRIDALAAEVLPAAIAARYYPRLARRVLAPQRIRASTLLFAYKRSRLFREPYGVIGIISPWNYPLSIPIHEVCQALIAGNAVLLKTATQCQPVGEALAAVFHEAGLDRDLLALVPMPGAEAGPAFIASGIDKLLFTGSTEVGRELMALAAPRLLPLNLELGGNDAMLVLADADLDRAAVGAVWAGLSNAGQSCGGVERIFVEEGVYTAFLERLKTEVTRLRQGPDTDHTQELGPLTTVEQRGKVVAQLEEAVAAGATLWSPPGSRRDGLFHPPTIVENAPERVGVMAEETFGPVLAVSPISDVEEGIRRANQGILGLTASVWSRDRRRARAVAGRLESGVVTINDHLMSHGMPETPWGGYKQSSLGRCHGEAGFHEVTQLKVVVDDLLHRTPRAFWWPPYGAGLFRGLLGLLDLMFARAPGRKLAGLGRFAGAFARSLRRRRA